ncbi:hypothetical protein BX600DRAFT_516714 [Xylariales sp. PMI_506]|nr:hypothetical protein BX600DRAFT_516714 [Xylariales sp. PMI_506]
MLKPITLRTKVLGVGRLFSPIKNVHGSDLKPIHDTLFMEDLHFHEYSGLLFGASEGDEYTRNIWFPPMEHWDNPESIGQGTIVTIDAKTLKATRLKLRNFEGPFNTHGIDIWSSPDDPGTIYIAAVNHLPNPEFYNVLPHPNPSQIPQARSRLELFRFIIGTAEAVHLRSIWHPLIRTPNDILLLSPQEMYVTNDHAHRHGLHRLLEDLSYGSFGQQTDLIHLTVTEANFSPSTGEEYHPVDDSVGIDATVANAGIHSNNGLAYGRDQAEILVTRTTIGQLLLTKRSPDHNPRLEIINTIQLPCILDNPSYFSDPYAAQTGRDASGYVLAGLARAITFPNGLDPVMVWLVQPKNAAGASSLSSSSSADDKWTQRLIFQDDGHVIRTASTAVLVAIDPAQNGGQKQAQLFVTGPLSKGVVRTVIDL